MAADAEGSSAGGDHGSGPATRPRWGQRGLRRACRDPGARSRTCKVIVATGNSERRNCVESGLPTVPTISRREAGRARCAAIPSSIAPSVWAAIEEENIARLASGVGDGRRSSGSSPSNDGMLKVCRDVEKLAATNVRGPCCWVKSGTGKEALAHALQRAGPARALQPFVAINCGAIPENAAGKANCSATSAARSLARSSSTHRQDRERQQRERCSCRPAPIH